MHHVNTSLPALRTPPEGPQRQAQQGDALPLPGRQDQRRRLGLVSAARHGRPGQDSFSRLRNQGPPLIDEATRMQQQQASSSEDF